MQKILRTMCALALGAAMTACGSAGASVDDDPGTEDGDVEVSAGGDITEGEAAVDVDVGDDDDPDDVGEGEYEEDSDPVDDY